MEESIANVFSYDDGQAVRIPAELRLDSTRVRIEKTREGDLVLHPLPKQRGDALLEALEGFDADFPEALERERESPLPAQDREEL